MKVKCTYSSVIDGSTTIVKGGIYEVAFDGGVTYIEEPCGQRLYFDLNTGLCRWGGRENLRFKWFTFEEVKDQPKHATSPEVLAQVFRKMADNVEEGLRPKEGVQVSLNKSGTYTDDTCTSFELDNRLCYRVKPDTITLKNGIEVPKPLERGEINAGAQYYYIPCYSSQLCHGVTGYQGQKYNYKLLYKTEDEAIQASVALFGLDIKDA